MMKSILLFISIMLFSTVSVQASIYKGQKVYMKDCLGCHGTAEAFVSSKSISDWESQMNKRGEQLAMVHLKEKKAEKSWAYFQSDSYGDKVKNLKKFLVEYAKNTGNVPACN